MPSSSESSGGQSPARRRAAHRGNPGCAHRPTGADLAREVSIVSPIAHSAGPEAVYVGPIFETQDDVQVRVVEGDFPEPCEICLARPTAVYVEIRRPDLDAS